MDITKITDRDADSSSMISSSPYTSISEDCNDVLDREEQADSFNRNAKVLLEALADVEQQLASEPFQSAEDDLQSDSARAWSAFDDSNSNGQDNRSVGRVSEAQISLPDLVHTADAGEVFSRQILQILNKDDLLVAKQIQKEM